MQSILKSFLVMGLIAVGAFASAAPVMDMGIVVGYRMNNADSATTGVSIDGKGGFQVGGLAFLPINEMFSFRTGFIYAQRNYEYKIAATGVTGDVEFTHFDIPATVLYKLGDMGGIYAGVELGMKLSDKCEGMTGDDCTGAKSMIVPVTFGGTFKIMPQFSVEAYYAMEGKLSDGAKDANAVGVNGVITFE
jgi:hypothetical protein